MSDGMALEKRRDVATTEEHLLNTDLVLIVDDDEDILELAAEILQTLGYDVLTARNGRTSVSPFCSPISKCLAWGARSLPRLRWHHGQIYG
jgi:hypothetical protein